MNDFIFWLDLVQTLSWGYFNHMKVPRKIWPQFINRLIRIHRSGESPRTQDFSPSTFQWGWLCHYSHHCDHEFVHIRRLSLKEKIVGLFQLWMSWKGRAIFACDLLSGSAATFLPTPARKKERNTVYSSEYQNHPHIPIKRLDFHPIAKLSGHMQCLS